MPTPKDLAATVPVRYHVLCYACGHEEESTDRHALLASRHDGDFGCVNCVDPHITLTRTETMLHRPSATIAMPGVLAAALDGFLARQPGARLFTEDHAQRAALVETLTHAALGVLATHPAPQKEIRP